MTTFFKSEVPVIPEKNTRIKTLSQEIINLYFPQEESSPEDIKNNVKKKLIDIFKKKLDLTDDAATKKADSIMRIIEESPEFRKFDRIINQSSSWTPEEKQQALTDLVDSIKVACITALLSLLMFSPAIGLAIGAGIIAASLFVLIRMMQTPDPLLALHDKIGKTIEESIPSPKKNVEMTLVKTM